MGKRIRHLEFYGFMDQNVFNGTTNIDLSDIKEKNIEQDGEIDELSGKTQGKADKSVVDELSGKVDNFIASQTVVNEEIDGILDSFGDDISTLSGVTLEMGDDIVEIGGKIDELSGDSEAMKTSIDAISASTEELNSKKLDKEEAENTYMQIISAYTKDEIDGMKNEVDLKIGTLEAEIEELSGETINYATKEELSAFSSDTSVKLENIDEELGEIQDSVSTISTSLNTLEDSITDLEDNVDELSGNVEQSISALEEGIAELDSGLTAKIDELSGDTQNKLNDISEDIIDKYNEFEVFSANTTNELLTKATKSELSQVSGEVAVLKSDLQNEINDRIGEDSAINERIDLMGVDIAVISSDTIDLNDRLNQEIQDRKNGDIALIGAEGDTSTSDTIWGAKRYSEYQKSLAVQESKDYTNVKTNELSGAVENKFVEFDGKLASKASIDFVNSAVTESADSVKEDLINGAIASEANTRLSTDTNLQNQIDDIKGSIPTQNTIDDIYNRINTITTYVGEAESYTDDGNGVLDVLHREFHALVEELRNKGIIN